MSRGQRYGLLFGILLLVFALQGSSTGQMAIQIAVTGLLGLALLVALWAAEARPAVIRTFGVTAALLFLASLGLALGRDIDLHATRVATLLLVTVGPPAIVIGVVRGFRRTGAVTTAAVFGVLSLYILLGIFFATLYGTLDAWGTEPFFSGGAEATPSNFLYFSFVTLTTVGYGDFTARSNLGHTLSVLEALIGQIYLVTVVSVIVSNVRRRDVPPAVGASPPEETPPS